MPYYAYEVREKSGKMLKAQTFASNRQELIKTLQAQSFLIISIKESSAMTDKYRVKTHRKAKNKDLVLFAKELGILLENGVQIIDAIDVLTLQLESSDLVAAAKGVKKDVEGGSTLRDAIAKYPNVFDAFWHDMIDAGEVSGQLPFVLKQMVEFLEAREELRKTTVSALLYPVLLLIIAVVVIFVFMFKVVPIFQELFQSFGSKLPPFTEAIISISDLVKKYFLVFVIIGATAAIGLKTLLSTKPGRRAFENIILGLPVVGSLYLALAVERFTSTLGVLLKSGIPIIRALDVSLKAPESVVFADRMDSVKSKVISGLSFADALQQSGLFPPIAVQLVMVGEKTGNFSGMLAEVSKHYKVIVDDAVSKFTALIGPLVLIFMAAVIGTLLVAMFLPIFNIGKLA